MTKRTIPHPQISPTSVLENSEQRVFCSVFGLINAGNGNSWSQIRLTASQARISLVGREPLPSENTKAIWKKISDQLDFFVYLAINVVEPFDNIEHEVPEDELAAFDLNGLLLSRVFLYANGEMRMSFASEATKFWYVQPVVTFIDLKPAQCEWMP